MNHLIPFTPLGIEEAAILQQSLLFELALAISLGIVLSNLDISTISLNRLYLPPPVMAVSTPTQNTLEISVEVEPSNSVKTATTIFDFDETVLMLSIPMS